MPDQPNGKELLEAARQTLLRELLDTLPDDKRYCALMIANAMAIAARESAADPTEQLALYKRLYGVDEIDGSLTDPSDLLRVLDKRLAADIRRGKFDDRLNCDLRAVLFEQTRARLRISNPKYLKALGLS